MKNFNKNLIESSKSIELRIIKAVKENKNTDSLLSEVEFLYEEELLSDDSFNFLTDLDLIKEIYS